MNHELQLIIPTQFESSSPPCAMKIPPLGDRGSSSSPKFRFLRRHLATSQNCVEYTKIDKYYTCVLINRDFWILKVATLGHIASVKKITSVCEKRHSSGTATNSHTVPYTASRVLGQSGWNTEKSCFRPAKCQYLMCAFHAPNLAQP